MTHYDLERERQYEEEQLNDAFANAAVIDCTNESNYKELLKKQIEENAILHKELAKLKRWKEQVLNLINEKKG